MAGRVAVELLQDVLSCSECVAKGCDAREEAPVVSGKLAANFSIGH